MLIDCPHIPTEQFLKGMSARVISKLMGTGAWQNSGGSKALSESVLVIVCPLVSSEEKGLFSQGPACLPDTPTFTEDLPYAGNQTMRFCSYDLI